MLPDRTQGRTTWQTTPSPTGPDLTQGHLPRRARRRRHAGRPCRRRRRCCWRAAATRCSRSAAHCTHYHGPLAEGLLVGDTVRCPWHHACFSLRTGEAAARRRRSSPLACWSVEQRDGKVFVTEKRADAKPAPPRQAGGRAAGQDRDRRRRRRRLRRGRDAAARGLRGQHRHAERRRCGAGRPAQPFQGLSRRQRARGMDAAARRRLLRRATASSCGSRPTLPPSIRGRAR